MVMSKREEQVTSAYDFFLRKFNGKSKFGVNELAEATGWKGSTVKTYLNKNFWKDYIRKTDQGSYEVINFEGVTFQDFMQSHTQVR
jgi:lipopolysaccharide export LptBFGC system permease protein LptF